MDPVAHVAMSHGQARTPTRRAVVAAKANATVRETTRSTKI
jgi:hypothetical protein